MTLIPGCTLLKPATSPRRIMIEGGSNYSPRRIIISSGTTVTWINKSETTHTVTAYGKRIPTTAKYFASGGFGSERTARTNSNDGVLKPGETFSHRFTETGVYRYFSIPYEDAGMLGIVQVR